MADEVRLKRIPSVEEIAISICRAGSAEDVDEREDFESMNDLEACKKCRPGDPTCIAEGLFGTKAASVRGLLLSLEVKK